MKQRKWIGWVIVGVLCIVGHTIIPNQVAAQNDLLVASPSKNSIERFDGFTGAYLGSFASGIPNANGVAVGPDGNVYISSGQLNEVHRYNGQTGAFMDIFASGNGMFRPNEVAFNGDYMYVGEFSSGFNDSVKRFDAHTGAYVDSFALVNSADGIEFSDDSLYVSSFAGGVKRYDLNTGAFIENFIDPGEGGLAGPVDLLFLDSGELLVGSFYTNSVKRFSADGVYIDDPITGLFQQEGLGIGLDGNVYAGSFGLGVINKYDKDNYNFLGTFVNSGPTTNFFAFRATGVPEPGMGLPLLACFVMTRLRRRKRQS